MQHEHHAPNIPLASLAPGGGTLLAAAAPAGSSHSLTTLLQLDTCQQQQQQQQQSCPGPHAPPPPHTSGWEQLLLLRASEHALLQVKHRKAMCRAVSILRPAALSGSPSGLGLQACLSCCPPAGHTPSGLAAGRPQPHAAPTPPHALPLSCLLLPWLQLVDDLAQRSQRAATLLAMPGLPEAPASVGRPAGGTPHRPRSLRTGRLEQQLQQLQGRQQQQPPPHPSSVLGRRHRGETEVAGVVAPLATPLAPQPASASRHNPASCAIVGCHICAYLARLQRQQQQQHVLPSAATTTWLAMAPAAQPQQAAPATDIQQQLAAIHHTLGWIQAAVGTQAAQPGCPPLALLPPSNYTLPQAAASQGAPTGAGAHMAAAATLAPAAASMHPLHVGALPGVGGWGGQCS